MSQLINLVVKDGLTRYKLLRVIGKWGPAFTLPLYEAAVLSPQDNKTPVSLVAFKIISKLQEGYYNMALQDIETSQFYSRNPNILPYMSSFEARVKGVKLLCIVLPYDNFVTSLRSLQIWDARFSRGLQESMIALILRRTLTGLDAIHQSQRRHTRITADTVFYDIDDHTFYLSYAASLYERTSPVNRGDWNSLPVNRMLAWALAPEVKHDESLEFVDVYASEESDIWLIGILALELAYGRILVENRRELLDIVEYICSDPEVLTDTWEELRIKSGEFARGADPLELAIVLPVEKTRFSKRFGKFLARCLAAEPQNRLSAEELVMDHEFLRVNVGKMKAFSGMFGEPNHRQDRFLHQDVGKKQKTSSKQRNHLTFRHNGITYTILEPIGKWGFENNLIVYEAVAASGIKDSCPQHVALKMTRDIEVYFNLAADSLRRSTSVNDFHILPLNTYFLKHIERYETLCMVLPFDAQVVSLRSIIQSRPKFAGGIPQICIAVSLLHALRGLQVIHSKSQDHCEITAGNIFYHIEDESIKLAYAASCYERTYAAEESGEFSMNKLLSWGVPPEIVRELDLIYEYDVFAADIWFIGIAALELAYGKIPVANSNELFRIASYISSVRELPNTWEELRTEAAEADILREILKLPTASDNPERFDRSFGNFVAMCLEEVDERASVNELLMDGFLRHVHEGESMEIFKAVMIKGYKHLDKKNVGEFLDGDCQMKQATSSEQSDHLSFCHNGLTYTILEPIGTWGLGAFGPSTTLPVYEAVTTSGSNDPSPQHIAFIMACSLRERLFDLASYSIKKSIPCSHINILPFNTHFFIQLKGHKTLCIVLPFDTQVLSLRSIIRTRPKFTNGIPQACIAAALLHTVRGLHVLHTKDEPHYEVNAGSIFYHIEDKSIKLAFGASSYERTYAAEESSECPINELFVWAQPPEVDGLLRAYLLHEFNTFKADIWFVGIAALELAYGKIQVVNREEMYRIASYISKVRRLPNTWEELKTEAAEAETVKTQQDRKCHKVPTAAEEPQRFNEYFGDFVGWCLDTEPDERPFANELLMHDFLRNVHEGESMEIFKAVMIKGCTDLD
ncbi:hypothetical protein ACET3Z_018374 [Daucus carota]